jgi:hypothetical protein
LAVKIGQWLRSIEGGGDGNPGAGGTAGLPVAAIHHRMYIC